MALAQVARATMSALEMIKIIETFPTLCILFHLAFVTSHRTRRRRCASDANDASTSESAGLLPARRSSMVIVPADAEDGEDRFVVIGQSCAHVAADRVADLTD